MPPPPRNPLPPRIQCGCLPRCAHQPCAKDGCRYHHDVDNMYCPLAGICVESAMGVGCKYGRPADPHRKTISVGLALLTKIDGTDWIVLQAAAENTLAVLDILRTNIDVPKSHSLTRYSIAEKCLEGSSNIPVDMVVPFRTISVNNTLFVVAALKPALPLSCLVSMRPLVFAPLCENASTMSPHAIQLVKLLISFGCASKFTDFESSADLSRIELGQGVGRFHYCHAASRKDIYMKVPCGCQPKCAKPDCTAVDCYQYHEGNACVLAGVRVESATSSPFEVVCKYGRPADPHRNTISVGLAIVLKMADGSMSVVAAHASESWCLKVDMLTDVYNVEFHNLKASVQYDDILDVCLYQTSTIITKKDLIPKSVLVVSGVLTFVSELRPDLVSQFKEGFKEALTSTIRMRRVGDLPLLLVPVRPVVTSCASDDASSLKITSRTRALCTMLLHSGI